MDQILTCLVSLGFFVGKVAFLKHSIGHQDLDIDIDIKILVTSYSSSSFSSFSSSSSSAQVSLVTKIVPSPDWFVGLDSLELCRGGAFLPSFSWEVGSSSSSSSSPPPPPPPPLPHPHPTPQPPPHPRTQVHPGGTPLASWRTLGGRLAGGGPGKGPGHSGVIVGSLILWL